MKKRLAKKILKDMARYHPHQIEKATFGHDTYLARVSAKSATDALATARACACEADERETPEDYYCLYCARGWRTNWADGHGEAVAEDKA
jgi:hypothetical protein